MSKFQGKRLLVSSGDGPAECRRAVAHVIDLMQREAASARLSCDVVTMVRREKDDPASVIVSLTGKTAERFCQRWLGTIQWTCKSTFRPNHKRSNWFVGVFELPIISNVETEVCAADLKIETFRAGGPGGQHQNTTNSAVRVTHVPSGTVAISRDERSQHRNRQTALRRLNDKLLLTRSNAVAASTSDTAALHKQIERGNPARCFKGPSFREVKR